uniref:Reverse transcriptase/retrotransposon-derived protein RNase H-like domain-containing protein n=1 Tax=Amphimedon queenslandica TaxID=400682 RepID=A0A1X7VXH6_AMPQE
MCSQSPWPAFAVAEMVILIENVGSKVQLVNLVEKGDIFKLCRSTAVKKSKWPQPASRSAPVRKLADTEPDATSRTDDEDSSEDMGMFKLLLKEFPEVFIDQLGTFKHHHATRHLKEGTSPRYHRPRTIPFALKDSAEKEIQRLVWEGILEPVNSSEWAAPIVVVPKKDGQLHICGDIEKLAKACRPCIQVKSDPSQSTIASI